MNAVAVRVVSVALFERQVTLRLPFRFGAATVTHCPQAFVRATVEVDGHRIEGASAELMVPKWFDKQPALTHEQNFEQLRQALRNAREAYTGAGRAASAHALHLVAGQQAIVAALALGLPRLAAQFGPAQIDKAVADAVLRARGAGWVQGLRQGLLGDPWSPSLALTQADSVALRHTVGLADRLLDSDEGPTPDDGLPATLESAIRAYGLSCFKLKLCGQPEPDVERLTRISGVLEAFAGDYRVTLDGNETFIDTDALARHWQALSAAPALQGLLARTLLLEQPLARRVALERPIGQLGLPVPVILDESDDSDEALDAGLALGYRGISTKACKGIYRSLRSAARIAREPGLLLSGEDLTCQAGLAVQQDSLLASSLGVGHIERNGHHYVDGFGIAPAQEAQAFAQAHPGLYDGRQGPPRLAVRQGRIDLRSLHGPGFGHTATPLWHSLTPIH